MNNYFSTIQFNSILISITFILAKLQSNHIPHLVNSSTSQHVEALGTEWEVADGIVQHGKDLQYATDQCKDGRLQYGSTVDGSDHASEEDGCKRQSILGYEMLAIADRALKASKAQNK